MCAPGRGWFAAMAPWSSSDSQTISSSALVRTLLHALPASPSASMDVVPCPLPASPPASMAVVPVLSAIMHARHGAEPRSMRTGNIADVLYGASLLPSLERLHMVGQGFTGTLPSNIQFPSLYHLNLGYNYLTVRPTPCLLHLGPQRHAAQRALRRRGCMLPCRLQGSLPDSWGQNGAFPALRDLFLSFNGGLSGTVPASWGADGSSMALLQRVQITNCNLSGPLPAAWWTRMSSLRVLDLSSNFLSGVSRAPPTWFCRLTLTCMRCQRLGAVTACV